MAPKNKSSTKDFKFIWNEGLMKTFVDLLLDYQSTNGIDQPFSWVDIATQFEGKVGKRCDRDVVKNKFDHMKKLWKDWKDLKNGETGLGWDAEKGTITADSEWWDNKIKVNV